MTPSDNTFRKIIILKYDQPYQLCGAGGFIVARNDFRTRTANINDQRVTALRAVGHCVYQFCLAFFIISIGNFNAVSSASRTSIRYSLGASPLLRRL